MTLTAPSFFVRLTLISLFGVAGSAAAANCVDDLIAAPGWTVKRTVPDDIDPFFREIWKSTKLRIAYQNHSDGSPKYFEIVDTDPNTRIISDNYKIEAKVVAGVLTCHIRTKASDGSRSKILRGRDLFDRMMSHFGPLVRVIRVQWDYGDNLKIANQLVGDGRSLTEAAAGTWTARQAARYGFTRIEIIEAINRPLLFVIAELTRP